MAWGGTWVTSEMTARFPPGSLKVTQHCLPTQQDCVTYSCLLLRWYVSKKFKTIFFSPSIFSASTPHTVPSCFFFLLRPVSVPFTGKCLCSARLEATGPASCLFTSSWLCGESKTMAAVILTATLVYSQPSGSYDLLWTMMTTRWITEAQCSSLRNVVTFLFSSKQKSSQKLYKWPQGRNYCVYPVFDWKKKRHPFSVLLYEIEKNTIGVL